MKKVFLLAGLLAATGAFAQYDNSQDYSGFVWAQGGAGVDPANALNTVTKLASDDANIDAKWYGKKVRFWLWQVRNNNVGSVQLRYRVRMHQNNSTNPVGAPGTAITGFSGGLSILAGGAGTWTGFYFDPATSTFVVPSFPTIWLGQTFDTSNGASAATATELNNIQTYMNNNPIVGTSTDKIWLSNGPLGSLTSPAAGTGVFTNFTGGNPKANLAHSLWAGRDIQGTLDLQSWPAARLSEELGTMEVYDASDNLVDSTPIYLFSDGTFETFTPITSGICTLRFKGRTWLSKKITGVDMSGDHVLDQTFAAYEPFDGVSTYGLPALPTITLLNGDVDGDDVVSVFDYIALSDAFDSVADQDADPLTIDPSPNWNANADLDGDYAVSVFDYIILSDNFDAAGDTVP